LSGPASSSQSKARLLRIGLWVAQILLALAFGSAGLFKATAPIGDVVAKLAWASALPPPLLRFIGASELAGAVGLVLPSLTRIKPGLTPLAAAGLVLVMMLAALFHVSRGEMSALSVNSTLGGLAAFVAWGRWTRARITPRT
jgi:putative oxidoreductase